MEARLALLTAPVVDTVTALPTVAFTQVLRTVSVLARRALVWVQTMATSPALTVRTLPASAVALPVQARLAL